MFNQKVYLHQLGLVVVADTEVAGPVVEMVAVVDIVAVVEPVAEVAGFRYEYILVVRSACL